MTWPSTGQPGFPGLGVCWYGTLQWGLHWQCQNYHAMLLLLIWHTHLSEVPICMSRGEGSGGQAARWRWATLLFGSLPKRHTPEKWCMITDLSFPEGASVNNGINPQLCSLQYMYFCGLSSPCSSVPWEGGTPCKNWCEGCILFDSCAPCQLLSTGIWMVGQPLCWWHAAFGLCSVPIIFTAVANAMKWMFQQWFVSIIIEHYLDDLQHPGSVSTPWICYSRCVRI